MHLVRSYVVDGIEFYLYSKEEVIAEYDKGLYEEVKFYVKRKNHLNTEYDIGNFTFAPMSGCCGVVISSFTFLEKIHRRTFNSKAFREIKEQFAKDLGYTMMIATTQMKNIPAIKNMFKSNYEIVKTFTNKRTGNFLGFGMKILK